VLHDSKKWSQRRNHIPQSQWRQNGVPMHGNHQKSALPTETQTTSRSSCVSIPSKLGHNHMSFTDVRNALRKSLIAIGPANLGIKPAEIDARSLRAGGARALLCANVDPHSIQLLGRWKSDTMIRYLHVSATPHVRQFARQMFSSGQSSFNPGSTIK
jgi:hypothetical protein